MKAAKSTILGLEPQLRAAFETELNTFYPLSADPVWQEQYQILNDQWRECQVLVDARCDKLRIPRRFRPSLAQPTWTAGGLNMIKELTGRDAPDRLRSNQGDAC